MDTEALYITNTQQWQGLFDSSTETPVLLFKHSTTCPISAAAFKQFESYLKQAPEAKQVKAGIVRVIESRPVSNEIAEVTGVKHESPQAILLKDKQVCWHASHWSVTKDSLQQAIMSISES